MGKTSLSHCANMQLYYGQLNIASCKHHLTGAQEMASYTMHSKKMTYDFLFLQQHDSHIFSWKHEKAEHFRTIRSLEIFHNLYHTRTASVV
jgi:hypothetical protein